METSIEKDFEEVINALLCGIETEREEFIDSNQDLIQRLEKIRSNKSNYGFIEYLDLFILSKFNNLICSTIKVPTSNENTYIIKNIIKAITSTFLINTYQKMKDRVFPQIKLGLL